MMQKAKVLICSVWVVFLCALFSYWGFSPAKGQTRDTPKTSPLPERALIDRFDAAMHQRFLTEPFFGMARMAPIEPQPLRSSHLGSFSPVNTEESSVLADLEKEGWKVGLYLYGRVANPKETKDGTPKFVVNYRLNEPLPITAKLKTKQLPGTLKLMKEVKAAFIEFQTPNSPRENNYEFTIGKWSYVARPVRAVNQSCLKCHTDHVITEKLPNGKLRFRKRSIGDANGVIVYGFSKDE